MSPAMTDRRGVSETFCSLPSLSAGHSGPVADAPLKALGDRPRSGARTKKAKSSKAPCLELSEGKIRPKGSGFLVLSPNLPKACGRSLQIPPAYDNEGRGLRLDALAKIRTD
ncbi:Hypothetical predicted protein [Xyrichtys novacula]|uniref:Uncharacterized protein n=1 Tax=Xyrichtys novacula TaxID=13765 RepID=A0AAV1GSS6_XYRNO|nr:Hypothetical predicted protein [Xyrichtys novacula]